MSNPIGDPLLKYNKDPKAHLVAGHDVTIFFPDWCIGYVQWHGGEDGQAEVYDTKGVEAGETEGADCWTCGIELNITEDLP